MTSCIGSFSAHLGDNFPFLFIALLVAAFVGWLAAFQSAVGLSLYDLS
jgi:hypothetical protein